MPRSEPEDNPSPLDVIQPEHRAAFAAFRRPQRPSDLLLAAEPTAGELAPALNANLARRVLQTPQGRIDIVPGRGSVGFVCQAESGECVIGHAAIDVAAKHGVGHFRSASSEEEVVFAGALPAGGRDLRITVSSGAVIDVPVNEDGGYWIAVRDACDMSWTRADGTTHRTAFALLARHLGVGPPTD